jgi:hypothetical protein
MSDLRTRIAATIKAKWSDLTLTDTWDENCLILADAVIRELGLTEAPASWAVDEEYELGSYTPSGRYRYVTEWSDRQPRSAEKLGLVGDGE